MGDLTLVTVLSALGELKKQSKSEWMFVTRDGKPFKSIRTAFESACRHANISGVTPHVLRHTFASRFAMRRAGDRTIQSLGRWKEPKMIQRYSHLSQQHLLQAVESLVDSIPAVFTMPANAKPVSSCAPVAQVDRAAVS
jgi:integrase